MHNVIVLYQHTIHMKLYSVDQSEPVAEPYLLVRPKVIGRLDVIRAKAESLGLNLRVVPRTRDPPPAAGKSAAGAETAAAAGAAAAGTTEADTRDELVVKAEGGAGRTHQVVDPRVLKVPWFQLLESTYLSSVINVINESYYIFFAFKWGYSNLHNPYVVVVDMQTDPHYAEYCDVYHGMMSRRGVGLLAWIIPFFSQPPSPSETLSS